MIRWRAGQVVAIRRGWSRVLDVDVRLDDGSPVAVRALAYSDLVGSPEVGDRVLLNTSALDLELGTGGYALVVAIPERLPPDPTGPGHLVKARYTPLQQTVLGVDEQDSPHHKFLQHAEDLAEMPVIVADLHSSLPAILTGLRLDRPDARVVYVATDGGALPIAFSRTVTGLRDAGWLEGSVTVGQAYGGDLEAVTVHNGMLAARHVMSAHAVVVVQGPGNLGTGTRWGFSGVAAGEAINAAATLNGRPVAALRVSQADRRDRHYGVSHHSLTAYGRVALAGADVPVPAFPDDVVPAGFGARVTAQAAELADRHRLVSIPLTGLLPALRECPVELTTMRRSLDEDPAAFLAAAAAGRHAASLIPLH